MPGGRITVGDGDAGRGAGGAASTAGIGEAAAGAVAAGDVLTDESAGGTACCATSSVLAGDAGTSSPPAMTVVDANVAGPLAAALPKASFAVCCASRLCWSPLVSQQLTAAPDAAGDEVSCGITGSVPPLLPEQDDSITMQERNSVLNIFFIS